MKFGRNEVLKGLNDTYDNLYNRTIILDNHIRDLYPNLFVIWECEWDNFLKRNMLTKRLVNSLKIIEPLKPRDSLCGGRSDVGLFLFDQTEEPDYHLLFYDVKSLYPSICCYQVGFHTINLWVRGLLSCIIKAIDFYFFHFFLSIIYCHKIY